MKKFLIILIVLLVIIAGAAAAFLATFDVDKFRPQIISQIENAIQKPVKLDKISLAWHQGIALELEGLAILSSKDAATEWIKLESAKAVVNLSPLLARQIQVTTLYLEHPVFNLKKRSDGTLEGLEPALAQRKPTAPTAQKPSSSATQAAALSFLVDEIKIEDGEFTFIDNSGRRPLEISAQDIDITLKNVGFNESIDFDAQAALLSGKQNVKIKGKLKISPQEASNTINNFHLESDLSLLDFKQLEKLDPSLAESGLQPPLEGVLTADVDSLRLDSAGLKNLQAAVRFTDGKVRLRDFKTPVSNIQLDVLGTTENIKVQSFSAEAAGGKIGAQGNINIRSLSNPVTSFNVKADGILLENLVESKGGPSPRGALSADFQGSMAGLSSLKIMQTLDSTGQIKIDQPVIENLNVLREVFQKLSSIPVFGNTLVQRLPANFQDKLEARDTGFDTIELPVVVQNGIVDLRQVNITSDNFAIQGAVSYNLLQKTPSGQAYIAVDPDLTAALTRSVAELSYFTSPQGLLEIPLLILPQAPYVRPNYEIIASKVATLKTREVLGNLIQKKTDGTQTSGTTGTQTSGRGGLLDNFLQPSQTGQTSSGTGTAPTTTKAPKASQILGQLLQSAMQDQDMQGSGNSQQ